VILDTVRAMHAEVFTIATDGQVRNGLLTLDGAGWESCVIRSFPARVDLVLAGVLVYEPEELGRDHAIDVFVMGSDGQTGSLGTIEVGPSLPAAVVKTPFAYPITLTLNGPVKLALTAIVEDGPTLGPTEFEVRAA
jgi:hypothetical protein